jgi:4-amino-4-deoxy-L-arabinose transferase-like glycosyltransferase
MRDWLGCVRSAGSEAEGSGRGDWGFSAAAGLLALLPRLYVAVAWAREPVWDGHYYDFGARRIAAGLGYSDDVVVAGASVWHPWCHYPVGYSGLLAGVYRVFGDGPRVATVVNALVGALLVVLAHRVARHLLPTWRARLAALLCALAPALVLYSALVMTELVSSLGMLLALWLALRWRDRRPVLGALLGGLALGLTTLVHPPSILLAPALGLVAAPRGGLRSSLRTIVARGSIATAVAVAVVAPWTLRNCRVMDGCAFVSTNAGWNLAIGALPRATGRFETLRASDGCEVVTGQVQQDRCWAKVGLRAIASDPARWLALAPKKLDQSFNHESFAVEYLGQADPGAWPSERRARWRGWLSAAHRVLLSAAVFAFVGRAVREARAAAIEIALAAGAAGLVAYAWLEDGSPFWPLALAIPALAALPRPGAPPRGPVAAFIAWAFAAFALVHVVFFGEDRYHVPLVPLLCLMAAAVGRACSPIAVGSSPQARLGAVTLGHGHRHGHGDGPRSRPTVDDAPSRASARPVRVSRERDRGA